MGGIRKAVHDLERGVPGILKHFRLSAEEVPQRRTTKTGVVDLIKLKLCFRMAVLELLDKIIVLGDVLGPLHSNVMLHPIKLILKIVSKM